MEAWPLLFLSLGLSTLLAVLLRRLLPGGVSDRALPPGPLAVPIIGNLLWLRRSPRNIVNVLRQSRARYGPIFTLRFGSRRAIFVADHQITHKALVELGAAFADRPAPPIAARILTAGQLFISSTAYGPLWRILRRNLTAEILHPARLKSFAGGRAWVLRVLREHLLSRAAAQGGVVVAAESFQFAVFCLLVFMCFGEKLGEETVREIAHTQRSLLMYRNKLAILIIAPRITQYLFRNRLRTAMAMVEKQRQLFLPLIEARRSQKQSNEKEEERFVYSYVDSLLNLELPDEEGRRKLSDEEIIGLCSEFLNGGTDTTATALEWTMANLVKRRELQEKLREEVDSVVTQGEEIKEEELQRMVYLKAVILEGLRLHPPGHVVLPHAVTEDVSLCGYTIPKGGASVNFLVAEMGRDGRVWAEPMEFRPERFLKGGEGESVDLTGSREIRMMPFGAGRRICPGMGMAMLHLEYLVANLVREFEWKAVDGDEIDLAAEKFEFTVVMKDPLRARILSRKETAQEA
ncbi:cytochrome P450 89A2-like [Curcuma longa]|uniref:cytochrome P450 89A2-like n=1 Tax=Curcuma longa TaxID=136217 RepID=UPI003D9E22FA